jgi:signal transduction histidine kinase
MDEELTLNYLGQMSFEIRSPLNNIIGFASMLAHPNFGDLNEKQQAWVQEITLSAGAILAIVDNLDLAVADGGASRLQLAPVAMRSIVDAAIFGVRAQAVNAHVTIDIAVEDGLNAFMANEKRMKQLLYGLLSNAVSHSKSNDTVRLTIWRVAGNISLLVETDGLRVSKDENDKVLQLFQHRTSDADHRDIGFGLVKELVEVQGGKIDIASTEGLGTRVTVLIPERLKR